jgi:hypothetical protein
MNTRHTRFAQAIPPVAALVDFRAGFFRCPTGWAGTTHNGKVRYPYLWSSRSRFANTRNRRVLSIRPPTGLRLAAARADPSLLV